MLSRNNLPTGWRRRSLGALIEDIASGVSVNSEARPCSENEIGVLKTSCVYSGIFRPEENKVVVADEVKRARTPVLANSIIVSRMNTPDLVGASGYVSKAHPKLFLPDRLWQIRTNATADARWLSFVLRGPNCRRQLKKISTGTSQSMKNISQSAFLALPVLVPPMTEQRQIADILKDWDRAIEIAEALIKIKQVIRDQFVRAWVSWERWPALPIGSVISAVSRPQPIPSSSFKALSLRSHGKGTIQRIVERPEEIDMDTVYQVGARDLIVNITFAWEGAIALTRAEDAGCLVSHRFPTFEVDETKINRAFLGYVVRAPRFTYQLGIASPGGAGRNRVLSKKEFLKIGIPYPPKEDQDRIANLLQSLDREVELRFLEHAAINTQRIALLQKLLTGEWRVPVRDGDVDAMAACLIEEVPQ